MKPKMFICLVNVSTVGALVGFVLLGKITVHQLPVVAVSSLILMNGAAFVGLRTRGEKK
jgi:hypothetical protein